MGNNYDDAKYKASAALMSVRCRVTVHSMSELGNIPEKLRIECIDPVGCIMTSISRVVYIYAEAIPFFREYPAVVRDIKESGVAEFDFISYDSYRYRIETKEVSEDFYIQRERK